MEQVHAGQKPLPSWTCPWPLWLPECWLSCCGSSWFTSPSIVVGKSYVISTVVVLPANATIWLPMCVRTVMYFAFWMIDGVCITVGKTLCENDWQQFKRMGIVRNNTIFLNIAYFLNWGVVISNLLQYNIVGWIGAELCAQFRIHA